MGGPLGSTYVAYQLQSIILPDHTAWVFDYTNDGLGDLQKVTFPIGGTISYTWTSPSLFAETHDYDFTRGISKRIFDPNNGSPVSESDYAYGRGPYNPDMNEADGTTTISDGTSVNGLLGTDANDVVHTFLYGDSWDESEADTYQGTGSTRTLLKSVQNTYQNFTVPGDASSWQGTMSLLTGATTIWAGTGAEQSQITYQYNDPLTYYNAVYQCGVNGCQLVTGIGPQTISYMLQTGKTESDYGMGSPGAVLKTTSTSYHAFDGSQNSSSYLSANLLDLVSGVTVTGTGEGSQTTYGYDENGSPQGIFGNQTSINQWSDSANANLTTAFTYASASFGMPLTKTDPKGNLYHMTYDPSGLYVTSITSPLNQITSQTFDFNTGQITSSTDENSQTTTYEHNDPLGRLTDIFYPDVYPGTSVHGHVNFTYNDSTSGSSVLISKLINPSQTEQTEVDVDGFGRKIETKLTESTSQTIYARTEYDFRGRTWKVWNASRCDPMTASSCAGESTFGVTTNTYDALNRLTTVTNPDSTTKQTTFSANLADILDENSRHWQQTTDGLGRLVQVMEPDPTNNTPSLETDYQYDALDDLTLVQQHGIAGDPLHTRAFMYDSLSHLTSACNPEAIASGSTCSPNGPWSEIYTYDANGNVTSKTDANNIRIQYCYDQLNRLLSKSIVDTSCSYYQMSPNPYAAFIYDSGAAFGVTGNQAGRLAVSTNSLVQNTNSAATIYSYDPVGRISGETIFTPSSLGASGGPTTYSLQALYDLAGNPSQITYPDGRAVMQSFDNANRLYGVAFQSYNGQAPSPSYNYLASTTYLPNGVVNTMSFGNGATDSVSLNSRLQPSESKVIAAPPGIAASTVVDRTYAYTSSNPSNCPGSGMPADNGNVLQVNDTLNSEHTQSFCYDNLNRLTSALIADQSLQQMLNYDSFGNIKSATGTVNFVHAGGPKNQITDSGYLYDNAGNLTQANPGVLSTYAYDAEDRLTSFNNGAATYVYDGEGNRIRKNVGNDWTEYVYWNGQPLAEKHADGTWSDYIFANGKRIARADNYDTRLHMSGVNAQSCSGEYFSLGIIALNPYTHVIQPGDILNLRQYSSGPGALGGLALYFSNNGISYFDPVSDTDGQNIGADTTMDTWHYRTIDLTPYAGLGLGFVRLLETGGAPAGQFDLYFDDISVTSKDGTVLPVFSKTPGVYVQGGVAGYPECVSNFNVVDETSASPAEALSPKDTTTYYHGDQIGSARLLTAGGGWAVWSGTYTPFGQEINPAQINPPNFYKFTGKERDEEEGSYLDYFGARYYSSAMGRWMSPDWAAKPEAVPYSSLDNPQSLNLYSYVNNNPLSKADPNGHCCDSIWMAGAPIAFAQGLQGAATSAYNSRYVAGSMKIAVGVGLVVSAGAGDVPGGAWGGAILASVTLGGTSTVVNGATEILGAATQTDVREAQDVLNSTSNLPGLAVTAASGGNLKAGEVAATVANAASLAINPTAAVKNPATAVDAATTVKDTAGLLQNVMSHISSAISGAMAPSAPPPPIPKAPPPPECADPGACR